MALFIVRFILAPPKVEYCLTDLGRGLEQILLALKRGEMRIWISLVS